MLSSNIAKTNNNDCEPIIEHCQRSIDAFRDVIREQDNQIDMLKKYNLNERAEVERLRSKQDGIWNNKYFWMVVGIGVGGAGAVYIMK